MSTKKLKSSLLVLAGIAVGCGAAATAPETFATNDAVATGGWSCYRANDFDNNDLGRGEDDAQKAELGMNRIASTAEPGKIVVIPPPGGNSMGGNSMADLGGVVCVKQ